MNTWLAHHGIKGQKWGVRRFQNKDGSLTAEGRRHVSGLDSKKLSEYAKDKTDFDHATGFEKWYKQGGNDAIQKKTNSIIDTDKKLTKMLSDDEKKQISDYLSKANNLNISEKEHETYIKKAHEVGKKAVSQVLGKNIILKDKDENDDDYDIDVGKYVTRELMSRYKYETNWKDAWYERDKEMGRYD